MPAPRSASGSGKSKPLGLVEHLAQQAEPRPVNSSLSLSKYYTSAELLLRQADSYRKEGNEEQLFVMVMRFASLIVETIPQHASYSDTDPKYRHLKRVLVERLFSELERLKVSLKTRDSGYQPQAHSRNRPADATQLAASNLPMLNWDKAGAPPPTPAPASAPPLHAPLAAPQPLPLLVDDLLDIMQHGTGPSPPYGAASHANGQEQQQQQGGALASLPAAPVYQSKYASSGGAGRHALFGALASRAAPNSQQQQQHQARQHQAVLLPRYPGLEAMQQLSIQPQPSAGPSLGPQEVGIITLTPADLQALPDTCGVPGHGQGGHRPGSGPGGTAAQPALSALPPPEPQAGGASKREVVKRAELRDVHLSAALMEEFLAFARANTSRNVESCGILAGTLAADDSVFTVTTLIVPKQEGTSDTVQALNEEEVYMVQFEAGLYPLGWIHTHPSQTCFLSSIDVHTHCGYQTMLDEAVAIVMAPTDRNRKCGIFRLSTPGGLQLVQRCELRGFHAHPPTPTGQELYELCGHVYLNPRVQHAVIDLR